MKSIVPIIEPRDRAQILSGMLKDLPGYVPGWQPVDLSNAAALMRVFSRYLEILSGGLNQVPDRSQMAFLDMLGTRLLPAQAAQAPLVFTLLGNAPSDVTLPEGCRVAARVLPAAPSPLISEPQTPAQTETIFSTRQTFTLTRAQLAAMYSIHPGSDEYIDHSADLTKGFTLFDRMDLTEHAIYLGHDELFAVGGENIVIMLSFSLQRFASRELKTEWEYLTESGWSPLESSAEDDHTGGLRQDGLIMLRREKGPKAKQETIEGRKSYWLRGRLASPLLPDGIGGERTVPLVNDIRAQVGFKHSNILPEAAFMDAVPLDISKDFYPFGQQPATHTTFYLACSEVFQRKGATVEMVVNLSQAGAGKNLKMGWEYFDGSRWQNLPIRSSTNSGTTDFTTETAILIFNCPRNWNETEVNGAKNYWLRARIVTGNYGFAMRNNVNYVAARSISAPIAGDGKTITIDSTGYLGGEHITITKGKEKYVGSVSEIQGPDKLVLTTALSGSDNFAEGWTIEAPVLLPGNLKPPVVKNISLSFTYLTYPFELDHCLSINDFKFEDHTADSHWQDRTFTPFVPVADLQPALHFGFDRALPTGLISLYLDIQDESADTPRSSPFIWEYRTEKGWNELGVLDETLGFRHSGMLQFIGQPDAVPSLGLGGNLYRIRARLKQGETLQPQTVSGVWLNAIWADQHAAPSREELGMSDGNPGQTFSLQRRPVLNEAKLEIQEWRGRGEGWRTTLNGIPESDLRFERDLASNTVTAVWVTWHEQNHLYSSKTGERHYTLERATGLIRLGDIPPAGSRIIATYSSRGGVAGNVPADAITELRMAIPYIQNVTNPIPASGGAEIESKEMVKQRGTQSLRHRERAVSAEDYEWLARQSSPDVARVRCLPISGPSGHAQRGWITLLVAPASVDSQPWPSPGFRRRVGEYLAKRVPAAVSRQVIIVGPRYTPVSVRAEIVPRIPAEAAQVEARVRANLNRFLHPLNGGSDGRGWVFGQALYLSQVARVIEETIGVDYAREILLIVDEQVFAEFIPIDTYALVAAGSHELKLLLGEV